MPGRPRKPTPLHLVEGHLNKVRPRTNEPAAEPVILPCPEYLDDAEKVEWEHFANLAGGMRITTREDVDALELLATSSAAAKELRKILRDLRASNGGADGDNAYVYETFNKDGHPMKRIRPEWSALQELDRKVLLVLGRFGLTPSDRSKVNDLSKGLAPQGGTDPDQEFTTKEQ